MKEFLVPLLAAVGTLLTALLTYLGVRYTQRQVGRATDQQAKLEQTKVDAAAYQRARESYDAALETLRGQVDDFRAQVRDLRTAREHDHEEMLALAVRIEGLERVRRTDRSTIAALSSYIRALLTLLRQAGVQYPPPPPGLSDTDPGGWAAAT